METGLVKELPDKLEIQSLREWCPPADPQAGVHGTS